MVPLRQKIIVLLKIISLFFLFRTAITFDCGSTWIQYYDFCYSRLFIEASYKDGLDLCAYHQSDVLTINSEDEQDFTTRYLLDNDNSIWLDSTNSHYKNWKNESDEKLTEKCAIVRRIEKVDAKWFRVGCRETSGVVCKKRAHLIPTTTQIPTTEFASTTTTVPEPTITTEEPEPTITTEIPKECPAGWKRYKSKCYIIEDKIAEFKGSEKWCQEIWGGHLASVHSSEDSSFLNELVYEYVSNEWVAGINLGGYSNDGVNFKWTDGSPFNYTNWYERPRRYSNFNVINLFILFINEPYRWKNYEDGDNPSICAFNLY